MNLALTERAAKDRRLRALGQAIKAYEAKFGVIAADEFAAQVREDRRSARVVRGERDTRKANARRRGVA